MAVKEPVSIVPLQMEVLHQAFTSADIILYEYELLLVAQCDIAGFWMHAALQDGDGTWAAWMPALPAQLDLTHLRTLRIRADAAHAFWPAVLAPMAKLEELSVALSYPMELRQHPAIVVLCTALAQEPALCSSLSVLRLEWLLPCQALGVDDGCVPRIADMLAARARLSGRRLDRLVLGWPTVGSEGDAAPGLVDKTVSGIHEVLGGLVQAVECLVTSDDVHVFQFEAGEVWQEVEHYAEAYWVKETAARPEYDLDELGL